MFWRQLTTVFLLVAAILIGGLACIAYRMIGNAEQRQMTRYRRAIEQLAHAIDLPGAIARPLRDTSVRHVWLTDLDGQILFASNAEDVGRLASVRRPAGHGPRSLDLGASAAWVMEVEHDGRTRRLWLEFSKEKPALASADDLVVGSFTLLGLLLLVLAAGLRTAVAPQTRQLASLSEAVARLERGEEGARASVVTGGEAGALAAAFNRMARELESREERTREEMMAREAADAARQSAQMQLMQAQKLETVGNLAGGIAHDFNNRLAVILGYVETAMDELPPGSQPHEDLTTVLQACDQARTLVRKLLRFSSESELELQSTDLRDLVTQELDMLSRVIGADVQVETSLAGELWPVNVDRCSIQQVLMNLALNARDAMPAGGALRIDVGNETIEPGDCDRSPAMRPGHFVRLTVADTGCGIACDAIDHLFEPFYTTKPPGQGTGLGLSVVFGVVVRHEGWIDVESRVDEGAQFHIYLPRATRQPTPRPIPRPRALETGCERVLLVEDDDSLRRMTRRALERSGFTVCEAANAEEAVDLFEDFAPDLLYTDVVLPGMSGVELVERMRARERRLAVLFTSGYLRERGRWRQILDSGYEYLRKPASIPDILRSVRVALDRPVAPTSSGSGRRPVTAGR